MTKILEHPKPMTVYCADGNFEFTPVTKIAKAFADATNASYKQGLRSCTLDDVLKAVEEERAGYDGLGKLWSK